MLLGLANPELRFRAAGSAAGYTVDLPDMDQLIDTYTGENMGEVIELEPLPDTQQVKKRGRPKESNDDAAKERESDVQKVQQVLHDLRRNELTNALEYTDRNGKTVVMQGQDLDLMTVKLSCENGIFIPEQRVKAAIQYAAGKNSYCPIRRYLITGACQTT